MNDKVFEALEILCGELVEMDLLFIDRNGENQEKYRNSEAFKKLKDFDEKYDSPVDVIKQALTELKSIKEANPSEALRKLNIIRHLEIGFDKNGNAITLNDTSALKIIEKALLKAQDLEKEIEILKEYRKDYLSRLDNLEKHSLKQDKALEIIKEKKIDVVKLCCSLDAESYNLSIEILGLNDSFKITQEEFDLLSEVL
jgi:hypothetical protein